MCARVTLGSISSANRGMLTPSDLGARAARRRAYCKSGRENEVAVRYLAETRGTVAPESQIWVTGGGDGLGEDVAAIDMLLVSQFSLTRGRIPGRS